MLPGLIDVHLHLMFGTGPRSYEDVIDHDSDDLMLLRGARNAYLHFGITPSAADRAGGNLGLFDT